MATIDPLSPKPMPLPVPPAVLAPEELAQLAERLQTVRVKIADAARSAGRDPAEITLIGVSKFFPASLAGAACQLGLTDLGENRVQEMLGKIDELAAAGWQPNWHQIGTLQKNKVRQIIGKTALIHSADSLSLLEEISRRSQEQGSVTAVLLQVNTAGEATKHGFTPQEAPAAAEAAMRLPGIALRGLMTMAPLLEDPAGTVPVFSATRTLFDRIAGQLGPDMPFDILSMGMSHDFVQAIACGSTHVRIGTAIFGPRL